MLKYLQMAALCLTMIAVQPAQAQEPAALSPEEIEKIVRDYLMREPEVIYEAIQEFQRRREVAEQERLKEMVVSEKAEIFEKAGDPVLGSADGDVTLVEFFDYRCGYCRRMIPGLQAMLAHDSKLRLVLKEFPVLGPESEFAARAALASRLQDEERYEEFHFALMLAPEISEAAVLELADDTGFDIDRLLTDVDSDEVNAQIAANRQLASKLGINGTPSFVIGEELIPGAVPVEELAKLIADTRQRCTTGC